MDPYWSLRAFAIVKDLENVSDFADNTSLMLSSRTYLTWSSLATQIFTQKNIRLDV